jgi:hypothetical protein
MILDAARSSNDRRIRVLYGRPIEEQCLPEQFAIASLQTDAVRQIKSLINRHAARVDNLVSIALFTIDCSVSQDAVPSHFQEAGQCTCGVASITEALLPSLNACPGVIISMNVKVARRHGYLSLTPYLYV